MSAAGRAWAWAATVAVALTLPGLPAYANAEYAVYPSASDSALTIACPSTPPTAISRPMIEIGRSRKRQ